ncbi:MAG: ribonuclease P protein component [Chlamydiales bacterium]|nr:ribonuclease P protein component [Chlamydiales bacterium]
MLEKFIFPKSSRLLRSREFRLCAKYGIQRTGRFLHLDVRQMTCPGTKIGLTVSRRYGKAVQRNRFKRLVREAFRLSQHELFASLHISVRPRAAAHKATLSDIRQELLELISQYQ